jgi:hypothetical protein
LPGCRRPSRVGNEPSTLPTGYWCSRPVAHERDHAPDRAAVWSVALRRAPGHRHPLPAYGSMRTARYGPERADGGGASEPSAARAPTSGFSETTETGGRPS